MAAAAGGGDSSPGSAAPGQDRTMRLNACSCDAKNQCLPEPVLLTASWRAERLCVKASPNEDAEISVSNSAADLDALVPLDIEFAVEIEAGSSFGVVRGAVPEDRFLVGWPREMVAAGRPDVPAEEREERKAGLCGRVPARAVGVDAHVGAVRQGGADRGGGPASVSAALTTDAQLSWRLIHCFYKHIRQYTTKGMCEKRWLGGRASNLLFNQSGLRVIRSLDARRQCCLLQLQLTDQVMNELSMYASEHGSSAEVSDSL